ncbi:MAG: UbiA family prenyltransferase [Anaerolineales bacterium]|nr:UbiA family prenyltransferase [Anaerolineales bacterium]
MNDPDLTPAYVRKAHKRFIATIRHTWPLIKSLQTLLLLITGLGGYMSVHQPDLIELAALSGSLLLAISGSTVMNMVFDRDIDARMKRTAHRPLPAGKISSRYAFSVGLALAWLGIGWSFSLSFLYGLVVAAGLFFDVPIYTLWLKRRTPWSILWGGIAGGMPILAGRTLGLGRIDEIGLLMSAGVLAWIPSHIIPLTIKYLDDYERAGIPTLAGAYGVQAARLVASLSVGVTILVMALAAALSGVSAGALTLLALLGLFLLALALLNVLRPAPGLNFGLFKVASIYMLGSMILIIVG